MLVDVASISRSSFLSRTGRILTSKYRAELTHLSIAQNQSPWRWDASISTTSIHLPVPSMLQCLQVATPFLIVLYNDVILMFNKLPSNMIQYAQYKNTTRHLVIPNSVIIFHHQTGLSIHERSPRERLVHRKYPSKMDVLGVPPWRIHKNGWWLGLPPGQNGNLRTGLATKRGDGKWENPWKSPSKI